MYSFRQRSDTVVVDEPLYGHYLRTTGADHPGAREVTEEMDNDGERVVGTRACASRASSSTRSSRAAKGPSSSTPPRVAEDVGPRGGVAVHPDSV